MRKLVWTQGNTFMLQREGYGWGEEDEPVDVELCEDCRGLIVSHWDHVCTHLLWQRVDRLQLEVEGLETRLEALSD